MTRYHRADFFLCRRYNNTQSYLVIAPNVQALNKIINKQGLDVVVDVTGVNTDANEIGLRKMNITYADFLFPCVILDKTRRDMVINGSDDLSGNIVIVIAVQQSTPCDKNQSYDCQQQVCISRFFHHSAL